MAYFKEKYDVIIVGGSIASLSCAIPLGKEGLDVLVLERHSLVGGVATSFIRGGYEMEASLHEMMSVGTKENPGFIRTILENYGVNVEWLNIPDAYKLISRKDDIDFIMPVGVDNAVEAIEKAVPGSKESVKEFFKWCKIVDEHVRNTNDIEVSYPDYLKKYYELVCTAGYTALDMMKYCNVPSKAIKILEAYWYYLGSSIDICPFTAYAVVMNEYIGLGSSIPKDTSYELAMKLLSSAKKHHVQVECDMNVDHILVENNKAIGVEVNNRKIYSDIVISNAYPNTVYSKLIKPLDNVPKKAISYIASRQMGVSCFSVIMILDKEPEYFGFDTYSTFISRNEMDSKKQREALYTLEPFDYLTMVCMNIVNPTCVPQGKTYISITTLPYGESLKDLKINEYFDYKDQTAEKIIDITENELGISFKEHIEEIEIITPVSVNHYTDAYLGGIYGYQLHMDDSSVARVVTEKKERFFKDLYFIGAHLSGDGMTPVIDGGRKVALDIIKSLRKKEA